MRASNEYLSFFLQSQSNVVRLECIEIIHSAFSKTFRIVRNAVNGVRVRHENGVWYNYEYYPLRLKMKAMSSDLDFGMNVDLGDLGDMVPRELQRIVAAGKIRTKPQVIYRSYRSDVLNKVLEGPYKMDAKTISYNREGCSFEASPSSINSSSTGEIYDLERFYPLRGFIY